MVQCWCISAQVSLLDNCASGMPVLLCFSLVYLLPFVVVCRCGSAALLPRLGRSQLAPMSSQEEEEKQQGSDPPTHPLVPELRDPRFQNWLLVSLALRELGVCLRQPMQQKLEAWHAAEVGELRRCLESAAPGAELKKAFPALSQTILDPRAATKVLLLHPSEDKKKKAIDLTQQEVKDNGLNDPASVPKLPGDVDKKGAQARYCGGIGPSGTRYLGSPFVVLWAKVLLCSHARGPKNAGFVALNVDAAQLPSSPVEAAKLFLGALSQDRGHCLGKSSLQHLAVDALLNLLDFHIPLRQELFRLHSSPGASSSSSGPSRGAGGCVGGDAVQPLLEAARTIRHQYFGHSDGAGYRLEKEEVDAAFEAINALLTAMRCPPTAGDGGESGCGHGSCGSVVDGLASLTALRQGFQRLLLLREPARGEEEEGEQERQAEEAGELAAMLGQLTLQQGGEAAEVGDNALPDKADRVEAELQRAATKATELWQEVQRNNWEEHEETRAVIKSGFDYMNSTTAARFDHMDDAMTRNHANDQALLQKIAQGVNQVLQHQQQQQQQPQQQQQQQQLGQPTEVVMRGNWVRLSRLLIEVCYPLMRAHFKQAYAIMTGREWSAADGKRFWHSLDGRGDQAEAQERRR